MHVCVSCVLIMQGNSNAAWVWSMRAVCVQPSSYTQLVGRECCVQCVMHIIQSTAGYCVMIHCTLWLENPVRFHGDPVRRNVCVFHRRIILDHTSLNLSASFYFFTRLNTTFLNKRKVSKYKSGNVNIT